MKETVTGMYSSLLAAAALILILPAFSSKASAQGFSYDGNRWYEVEVTIFSNAPTQTLFPELTRAGQTSLLYPPGTRLLGSMLQSLRLPQPEPFQEPATVFDFSDSRLPVEESPVRYGPPEYTGMSPRVLPDVQREAFTLLGEKSATFTRHNSRLRNSVRHRILFHGVWRQPMLNPGQSVPVAITGGSRYAPHHELEGWLRFSFNVNRIDVEASLWLMQFLSEEAPPVTPPWAVPLSPVENARIREQGVNNVEEPRYQVSQLWKLQETRQMISNNLHYLDHPMLGMMVEVRPYQLPLPGEGADY